VAVAVRVLDVVLAEQADQRAPHFRGVEDMAKLGCMREYVVAEVWTQLKHQIEFACDGLVELARQRQVDLDVAVGDVSPHLLVV